MRQGKAIIIGAGPAGLTAAFELLLKSDIVPTVLEKSDAIGGISRTVNYKGNRIDIGGHRFFSKSDRVMDWWLARMPLEARAEEGAATLGYQNQTREIPVSRQGLDAATHDLVMLLRERRSRIYYLRRFFDYPISLSPNTLLNLGLTRTARIGLSYIKSIVSPIPNEKNLEEFLINRFGDELYRTFFKDYTEKVWGTACANISAEWGAQRIKALNITKTITHAVTRLFRSGGGIAQKQTETSLIERFLYPKFGPGQMWEEVARQVVQKGGTVLKQQCVHQIEVSNGRVRSVTTTDAETGEETVHEGDYFFSTMPVQELVRALRTVEVPEHVRQVSEGLVYRDFITVGLLLRDMKLKEKVAGRWTTVRDNWIYIQEPDVHVGRLQIFNNWSPFMVRDPSKVWIGLEYFCNEGDPLWRRTDAELGALAQEELKRMNIIDDGVVEDIVVVRQEKTYPAYFGTYDRFQEVREYLDGFENLFLIGRNGMHKYNNQDHSMLTAMTAVENIVNGITDKSNLWNINTEVEYHEEKGK